MPSQLEEEGNGGGVGRGQSRAVARESEGREREEGPEEQGRRTDEGEKNCFQGPRNAPETRVPTARDTTSRGPAHPAHPAGRVSEDRTQPGSPGLGLSFTLWEL